jgi:endonuclease/exonuclease/phosphatase family metal-dependent hydrolase
MRVVTYNIHKGLRAGGRSLAADPMKSAVHALAPDLLFLQEVVGEHTRFKRRFPNWPEEPQHDFFRSDALKHFAYGKNMVYPHGHHGNALLSRLPMLLETNVDISVFSFGRRGFIYSQLKPYADSDVVLHAICVHMGLVDYERKLQAKALCEYIEKHVPPDAPLIVAGDFNDWLQKLSPYLKQQAGLDEAFLLQYGAHARSFPSWLPISRLDRIYFRNLQLKFCERPTGEPWKRLSDHLPLVADFEFSGR